MGIAAAVVGAVIGGFGLVQQRKAAKKAAKAQKKANNARAGQAAIENRQRRAELIRQRQVAQAQAENIQATQGGGEVSTTMATGALATASTQGAVNLANFNEFGRQGGLLASAQLQLGKAESMAAFGKSLTSFGGTIMGNSKHIGGIMDQGLGKLKGVFGSQPPAPVVDRSRAHPSVYEGYT